MTRQRILFVDDDPNIAAGLRNLLRRDRHRWDVEFATSGESALLAFAAKAFDIIVCDMRMPGMDGATLLTQIKRDYPETTRIVLSGQTEPDGIVRAIPVTHQFLCKPCDGEVLRAFLERTCDLRTRLVSDTIKKIVGQVHRLPSVPGLYWELVNAASRNDVANAEIAAIVERDPAMTAKILQLVNSAYFGLAQHIASIPQAVNYLGIDLVKGLTLTAHLFESQQDSRLGGLSLAGLQKHSLLTALLGRRFASTATLRQEIFTAAIVHDIGKVLLAHGFPEPFQAMMAKRDDAQPAHLVEKETFGATHAEVGAYLLGIWGLPFSIVEAVAFHHEPGLGTVSDPELLAVLHVAEVLTGPGCGDPGSIPLDLGFLETVGLADRLPEWEARAREYFEKLPEQG